jgi:hypothetical protein
LNPFTFKSHVIISCGWVILHCVYITYFHDPFFSCRASGLFPELSYLGSAAMNSSAQVSTVSCFMFFWVDVQISITGSYGCSASSFLRNLHNVCTNLHSSSSV